MVMKGLKGIRHHVATIAFALLIIPAFVVRTANANTFVVSDLGDSGPNTLRAAINNANFTSGPDTITFSVTGTIHLLSELVVQDDLTILGAGPNQTVLDGGGTTRIMRSDIVPLTISGLTLRNGNGVSIVGSGEGGALRADGPLTLTNVIVLSNTANTLGGGVYADQSARMINVRFDSNHAVVANSQGGGLFAQGALVISRTQFLGNHAASGGGLMFDRQDTGYIVNTLFARNSGLLGSAMFLGSQAGAVIAYTTIASPSLSALTAIYVDKGPINITDTIVANYAIGIFKNRADNAVLVDHSLFFNVANIAVNNAINLTNPVTGNPRFVDSVVDNYRLGRGSAAIDAGVDVGVNSDFEGDRRPIGLGFDIGYDEAKLAVYLPLVMQ